MIVTAVPLGWDDDLYLESNPDVRKAIERGGSAPLLTGYDHYIRYGLVEGRSGAWKSGSSTALWRIDSSTIVRVTEKTGLPEWTVEEILAQSVFAPSLDAVQSTAFPVYDPFNKDPWGQLLREVCRKLRHVRYDYMFFLPWIKRGGADLASILHIQAAAQSSSRIAVVLTEPGESDWLDRLPSSADVLFFGRELGTLPLEHQALACYHLVVALRPAKLHVINSAPAWRLLTDSSQVLAELSELYVSLYCYDHSRSGEPIGYARMVRQCASNLTRIFTDNTAFRRHLVDDIGVPSERVVALRHAVLEDISLAPPPPHSRQILWASRLDRQKRPDLVVEIARRLSSLKFVVYGSAVLEQCDEVIQAFNAAPNIEYRGEFSRISQIMSSDYRLFLYTSAWDGLPNIVLEVMRAGMLVVAGAVGGIRSDLGPDNCLLVTDHDSPDAYVSAIKAAYASTEEAEATRLRGQAFVRECHTFAGFLNTLRSVGYVAAPQATSRKPDETSRRITTAASGSSTNGHNELVGTIARLRNDEEPQTRKGDKDGVTADRERELVG